MSRAPQDSDFFVEVAGIGSFRFGRRTYGDRMRIRAEFVRLTRELGDVDESLASMASVVAAHKVLCVEAPDGWFDLEAIDMISAPDAEDKVFAIYEGLRQQEETFRQGAREAGAESGQGAS